jgi:hypothetical protein
MGRWVRIVSVVGLLSGVMALGGPAGAQAPGGGCSEPYPPVFTGSGYYQDQGLPEVGPRVPATTIFATPVLDRAYTAQITQGNGTEIVVERPTGELRLTNGGAQLFGTSAGDLDGDGFSEIWVNDIDEDRSWVVPYSTAAGTAEVGVVGIEAPSGAAYGSFSEGRPMDLYLVVDDGTNVYSGEQVLAAGPGGDASALPPIGEHPGLAPLSVIDFSAGPELILVAQSGPTATITSSGASTSTFLLPVPTEVFTGQATAIGREGPGGRYLQLNVTDRGGGVNHLWSYDDPCTSLEVAATPSPTTAPPAAAPLALTG